MMEQFETVFLTGAAGFIGRKTAEVLVRAGYGVIATDTVSPREPFLDGIEFYAADIRDIGLHAGKIAGRCQSIVHCGGISGPMLLNDNPAEVLDINIRGTTQLLSLAEALKFRRFIAMSSVSAYGNATDLSAMDEDAALTASTFYGTSKAATDLILQSFAERRGLSAVALRIGWVYGPGRMTDALIQPIVRSALGKKYELATGADHYLQFVHVDDVAEAIRIALAAPSLPKTAYNINGREFVRVGDMLEKIRHLLPQISAAIGTGLLQDTDVQGHMLIDAAKRDLGWEPAVSFDMGLAAYIDWLKEHPY
ncbi:NAD-dependent epimerase/dehydratase family protein [Ochrobactrum soli]|uniref:NAD(P)-dependent oxidoreductase n=1 Tax=Ochrobactrum soli TaxID=2448455 RepID=A0A849KYS4_9HYPH|nr:NAD(P)-dependent oxidoreductase [[Ochrobactrum] soli]NNU63226.1 NAD(P)-dependent oxidoreductase [[Ochrobactrum] soli]